MDLKEFVSIALDIERDSQISRMCESCERRSSQYLYLVKSMVYGIFHICDLCREEILKLPKPVETTAFVPKAFSTME